MKINYLAQMQCQIDYGSLGVDDEDAHYLVTPTHNGLLFGALKDRSCSRLSDAHRHKGDDSRRFSRAQSRMLNRAQAYREEWLDPHASVALDTSHYTPVGPMTFNQVEW